MLTEENQQQLDNSLIEPGVVITIKKDNTGKIVLSKVVPKGDPEYDSEKNVLPKEQPQSEIIGGPKVGVELNNKSKYIINFENPKGERTFAFDKTLKGFNLVKKDSVSQGYWTDHINI